MQATRLTFIVLFFGFVASATTVWGREPATQKVDLKETLSVSLSLFEGLSQKELARLTRQELFDLFAADLRAHLDASGIEIFDTELIRNREEIDRLVANGSFFELELEMNRFQGNLWGSNGSELIYTDDQYSVWRINSREYDIINVKTGDSYSLNLEDGGINLIFYEKGQFDSATTWVYGKDVEQSDGVAYILSIFGIELSEDAEKTMQADVDNSDEAGGSDGDNKAPESDQPPADDNDSSLYDDFVEEAAKAWELFLDMVDDAIDYGPDYVDPDAPALAYTASLDVLLEQYWNIRFNALINSDRNPNPMADMSNDALLARMLADAFYVPPAESDPLDRPLFEGFASPHGDLTFDGAIDYGDGYFGPPEYPDDIPRDPKVY